MKEVPDHPYAKIYLHDMSWYINSYLAIDKHKPERLIPLFKLLKEMAEKGLEVAEKQNESKFRRKK